MLGRMGDLGHRIDIPSSMPMPAHWVKQFADLTVPRITLICQSFWLQARHTAGCRSAFDVRCLPNPYATIPASGR